MNKELYDELREIEDRLYNIADKIGEMFDSELGDSWASLYTYLEKVNTSDLE